MTIKKKNKIIIPFGKYQGKLIFKLPSSYLKWIAENVDEDDDEKKKIVEEADKEWQLREIYGWHFEEEDM